MTTSVTYSICHRGAFFLRPRGFDILGTGYPRVEGWGLGSDDCDKGPGAGKAEACCLRKWDWSE